jgi:hypothetical protein
MKRVLMGAMILVLAMVGVALAGQGKCEEQQKPEPCVNCQQTVVQQVTNEYSTTQVTNQEITKIEKVEAKKQRTEQVIAAELIVARYSNWLQVYGKPGYDTANGKDRYEAGVRIDLPEVFPGLWFKKPGK